MVGGVGSAAAYGRGSVVDREQTITTLLRRARESESAMVRCLSRDELAWLVEPLLPVLLAEVRSA